MRVIKPLKRTAALGASAAYRAAALMRSDEKGRAEAQARSRALQLYGGKALTPRFSSLRELIKGGENLLQRQFGAIPLGQPNGTVPRDVIIIDDFYEDPDAVRAYALKLDYELYLPGWFSSALESRENPLKGRGTLLATPAIRERLAQITHDEIDETTWPTAGDGWNGAFHYKLRQGSSRLAPAVGSKIHNHVGRDSDVQHGGWSALVYLSHKVSESGGTTIWKNRATQRCWSVDSVYSLDWDQYEPILDIEYRYNRLVLMYASLFHLSAAGWGTQAENARLFQTFFWNVRQRGTKA